MSLWPCRLGHFRPQSTVTCCSVPSYTSLSDLSRCYEVLLMLRVHVVLVSTLEMDPWSKNWHFNWQNTTAWRGLLLLSIWCYSMSFFFSFLTICHLFWYCENCTFFLLSIFKLIYIFVSLLNCFHKICKTWQIILFCSRLKCYFLLVLFPKNLCPYELWDGEAYFKICFLCNIC